MSNRDTVTYELKQGNKVVYVGTTNNPDRRQQEHDKSGKNFSKMNITKLFIILNASRPELSDNNF